MTYAVSNIAWTPEERKDAYTILQKFGVAGLEIAPGLFFYNASDPFNPSEAEADAVLSEIRDAGLTLVSMQSLLFGAEGVKLFGSDQERSRFFDGMSRAITLAGRFAIPNLVFGSPKQRIIPDDMAIEDAQAMAIDTFRRLGDLSAKARTCISIEANPAAYGTNFLTEAGAAAEFVAAVDHPAIRLILDVGAMHLNDQFDTVARMIGENIDCLNHVHISEPFLEPAPKSTAAAATVLEALRNAEYDGWVSIEMKRHQDGLSAVEQSVARLMDAAE
ncbi:sugar phosphate isomerase/epimerase [Leisingera sp. HS039]|uniref:sugar phosphate isomerase/epimerase family protein n=1 Tax=Leisingera sp. HS039 TaxID=2818496 RepID=UPI001B3A4BEE|nr:sugar phosphate isomerase/epimerase [Leisingera sp. HS039]MBQ4824475.1 sugar phosphate isomerase/epimerase [Leisingera sp. HS039]